MSTLVSGQTAVPVWQHADGAVAARLDGGRWHFQHGPIDLIIGADGDEDAVKQALQAAWQKFTGILTELVAQLPALRRPVVLASTLPAALCRPSTELPNAADPIWQRVQGETARRMLAASLPYAPHLYITPMVAVAGAVADEIIAVFAAQPGIQRAYVNNGGDIALYLAQDAQYRVGLFADVSRPGAPQAASDLDGGFTVSAASPVRGVATSGWRGRSFSLGIADSVTVLASTAAGADAAATVIANQVTVQHPAIRRAPADTLKDDSDLGQALVTVEVGSLPEHVVEQALARGAAQAQALLDAGLIEGAALVLQGQHRVVLPSTP
ncbi:UPF0280 family protein [Mesopusillimonas faecipullorum]|uniref:UPF0280 family protein n=1 Tax=Mesopusillimonas faecipullorum TaxID=2755040 RepID=UPI001D01E41C|nr:UPF0280 family protein [Mesopusillimonas faecipullorum]